MKAKYLEILKTGERLELSKAEFIDTKAGAYEWPERNFALYEMDSEEPYFFAPDPSEDEPVTGTTIPFALIDQDGREVYRNTKVVGLWL